MKAVLLYNPNSGRGVFKPERVSTILEQGGWSVTLQAVDFNANPFDGNEDIDVMIVAGGDGSINYALNSMKAKGLDITIAVIPAGTANDFAGAIGMSHNPEEAANQILTGAIEHVDCGLVNDKYYINVFSFGTYTTTSEKTPDRLKHLFGNLAYIFAGFKETFTIHKLPLHIEADGQVLDTNALIVLVFNGQTAGQYHFAPEADIKDGKLDIVILRKSLLLHSAAAIFNHLMLHLQSPLVKILQASSIKITSMIDEPTDVDGQPGPHFPLEIKCIKDGVKVIIPLAQK